MNYKPRYFNNVVPKIAFVIAILSGLGTLAPSLLYTFGVVALGFAIFMAMGFLYPKIDVLAARYLEKAPEPFVDFVRQFVDFIDGVPSKLRTLFYITQTPTPKIESKEKEDDTLLLEGNKEKDEYEDLSREDNVVKVKNDESDELSS